MQLIYSKAKSFSIPCFTMLRSLTVNSLCLHSALGSRVSNAHAVYRPAAEQRLRSDRHSISEWVGFSLGRQGLRRLHFNSSALQQLTVLPFVPDAASEVGSSSIDEAVIPSVALAY
jgi:hypothetical protein